MALKTISDEAYHRVKADVLSGALGPGQRLKLQSLQQRYELGLSPIREALMLLCGEGLLTNEGQRGFSVAALSKDELLDLMDARISIETLLLTDAITFGDDEWGANIAAAHYRLKRVPLPSDPQDNAAVQTWELANRALHFALLAAARSRRLLRFDEQLVIHFERYRRMRLRDPDSVHALAELWTKEHEELMDAALSREVGVACSLLKGHLERSTLVLAERFTK